MPGTIQGRVSTENLEEAIKAFPFTEEDKKILRQIVEAGGCSRISTMACSNCSMRKLGLNYGSPCISLQLRKRRMEECAAYILSLIAPARWVQEEI